MYLVVAIKIDGQAITHLHAMSLHNKVFRLVIDIEILINKQVCGQLAEK